MNKIDKLFNFYILDNFSKKYNITREFASSDPKHSFRLLCFKMNYFMSYIILPKFKKTSLYEAVFIEFRVFPHIEFQIRNAIMKLGTKWAHTIICGNLNYDLVTSICKTISPNINIVKINVDNMTQSEYSKFLTTMEFWNLLKGEKILIYQEDSIIFKNNINDFLEYDFIGAPFLKSSNDTPNCVGNGGLSLRTKSKMIDVISKFSAKDYKYNSSTLEYMNYVGLEFPPEDVYFSKCMQENFIGIVANWDIAQNFSSEIVFNKNSFGCHKWWISNDHWKSQMKKNFNFKNFKPKSNLNKLLIFNDLPLSFNLNEHVENAFDIDLFFFCKANNIEYTNDVNAINYFNKIAIDGFIYHPKQLLNMYPNLLFYTFLDNIFVIHEFKIIPLYQFVNKNIYNSSFTILSNLLINKKYTCLNDNYDILILVFIGDEQIGIDLIQRIIKYKDIQNNFNVAFCFNENTVKNFEIIKQLISTNFDFYAIYKSKELGSDIIPTILMYDDIIKTHKFQHIFKFHTKSIQTIYQNLTNYLTSKPLLDLINENENQMFMSNCVGDPNYYVNIQLDYFNNTLKQKHFTKIDMNKTFVGGTIFYTTSVVFDAVLNFVKNNNYRSFLLNNLYENNSINKDFSPNHFLERLFGIIKLN